MTTGWKRSLAYIFCIGILGVLLCTIFALQYALLPIHTPGNTVQVHIRPGQTLTEIAGALQTKKVISNPLLFSLLARVSNLSSDLQSGEFEISTAWSRLRILRTLASGSQIQYSLRVPEGLTWWQTAEVVAQSGLTTYEKFKRAVHDQELLAAYNIPADSAEGYLFPETYRLPRPAKGRAEPIVRMMLKEFEENIRVHIWPEDPPDPEEIHDLVILASLVEKETAHPEERRAVAGVFVNRLQRGMRLQCDPTIIYGLGQRFDGNLTRSDLEDADNAYNTYTHAGLPPGPICSPSLASLQAALNPEDHNYLYFVSKGDGSHHFSRSLKEHNRAVRRYQLP